MIFNYNSNLMIKSILFIIQLFNFLIAKELFHYFQVIKIFILYKTIIIFKNK